MLTVSKHIKALIFDCDGTLADTMPVHNQSWHAILDDYGLECEQSFFDPLSGMPTKEIVELMNKKLNRQLNLTSFVSKREDHIFQNLVNIKPIAPIVNIVKEYHGKLPMCVVSGGSRKNVIATLKAIELNDYFTKIITADDPIAPKPSPDIFLYAAQCMNTEPKYCQVFEDGELGLIGAKEAGMVATDVRPQVEKWSQTTIPQ